MTSFCCTSSIICLRKGVPKACRAIVWCCVMVYCENLSDEIVNFEITKIIGKMAIGDVGLPRTHEPEISNDAAERCQTHGLYRTSCERSISEENRLHCGFIVIVPMILSIDISTEIWCTIPLTPFGMSESPVFLSVRI